MEELFRIFLNPNNVPNNVFQLVITIIVAAVVYFKLKNGIVLGIHKELDSLNNSITGLGKDINGLGSRFDKQFGEYKDKQDELNFGFDTRIKVHDGQFKNLSDWLQPFFGKLAEGVKGAFL